MCESSTVAAAAARRLVSKNMKGLHSTDLRNRFESAAPTLLSLLSRPPTTGVVANFLCSTDGQFGSIGERHLVRRPNGDPARRRAADGERARIIRRDERKKMGADFFQKFVQHGRSTRIWFLERFASKVMVFVSGLPVHVISMKKLLIWNFFHSWPPQCAHSGSEGREELQKQRKCLLSTASAGKTEVSNPPSIFVVDTAPLLSFDQGQKKNGFYCSPRYS